jgi:hypothetical protein
MSTVRRVVHGRGGEVSDGIEWLLGVILALVLLLEALLAFGTGRRSRRSARAFRTTRRGR